MQHSEYERPKKHDGMSQKGSKMTDGSKIATRNHMTLTREMFQSDALKTCLRHDASNPKHSINKGNAY